MTRTAPEAPASLPATGGVCVARRHVLTVTVEDWFQAPALQQVVQRRHWPRLEARVGRGLQLALDLLQRHRAHATFFVSGWLAEQDPALVRRIAAAGHEVGSAGFWPGSVDVERTKFAAELDRARVAIEAATGTEVIGHRAGRVLREGDRWLLAELRARGYAYDASMQGGVARRADGIWEVPVSCGSVLGLRVPFGGSARSRQLPPQLVQRSVARWLGRHGEPLVCSFRTCELDLEQPRVTALSRRLRIAHYRHLERTRAFLEQQLAALPFVSVASSLGLTAGPAPVRALAVSDSAGEPIRSSAVRTAVSVVVPVCNEEESLPALFRAMDAVAAGLFDRFEFELVLVDDGSRDRSWAVMQELAAGRPRTQLLRHDGNRGIARAIATGLRAASSDVVVSIDCDCSYDPAEIGALLPLLEGADVVTASPYHPQGKVRNVPRWRLLLSRTLSWAYRRATGCNLHTWTSCFRAYRKSAVLDLEPEHPGFLGIAELLIRAVARGRRVVEHPAMLESRLLGTSKLKTLRTIRGHLGLLWQAFRGRVK